MIASPDALVRTRCNDCRQDHPVDTSVALAESKLSPKRLRNDDEPPELCRRLVLLRSDGRCEAPYCSRPIDHLHHIHPRRKGIDHHPDNLLGLCATHHLRIVETGIVKVTGQAPGNLTWEYPERTLKSGDYPTSWERARRLWDLGHRERRGDKNLDRKASQASMNHEPGYAADLSAKGCRSEKVTALVDLRLEGRRAYCDYSGLLGELARPERRETRQDVCELGYKSLGDACQREHELAAWQVSERKRISEAASRFPVCHGVFMGPWSPYDQAQAPDRCQVCRGPAIRCVAGDGGQGNR